MPYESTTACPKILRFDKANSLSLTLFAPPPIGPCVKNFPEFDFKGIRDGTPLAYRNVLTIKRTNIDVACQGEWVATSKIRLNMLEIFWAIVFTVQPQRLFVSY